MEREHSWNLRVKSEPENQVTVFTRDKEFRVGVPLSFDREYEQITALEQSLGSFAGDLVNGFRQIADEQRVEISNVEATITAELNNPLTYLNVVGEEGNPSIESIFMKVYVSSFAPDDKIKSVWKQAQKRSPLYQTLRQSVDINLKIQITM